MARKRTVALVTGSIAATFGLALGPMRALAGVVLTTADGIIRNSSCVGVDCPNSPAFDDSTMLMMENNTRIKFGDTSNAPFPNNDWEIEANSSLSGGQNYLGFNDCGSADDDGGCASDLVFAVEAGVRASALYVQGDGDVGIGTSNPALDLHLITGNSPAIRLDQDGTSGFTPQVWDIAGNETNFFIRDTTSGSRLPFRIRPGAPSSSILIDINGNVGLGTSSPSSALDITRAGSIQISLTNTTADKADWKITNNNNTENLRITVDGSGKQEFNLTKTGDLALTGSLTVCSGGATSTTGTCAGAVVNLPDYVFSPDYRPMPLAALESYVATNRHLPGVLSAADAAESGIDLTALQLGVLANVEELLLHTIEQQKSIDEMSNVMQMTPQDSPPAGATDGAIYVDGTDGATLCFRTGGAWVAVGGAGTCG